MHLPATPCFSFCTPIKVEFLKLSLFKNIIKISTPYFNIFGIGCLRRYFQTQKMSSEIPNPKYRKKKIEISVSEFFCFFFCFETSNLEYNFFFLRNRCLKVISDLRNTFWDKVVQIRKYILFQIFLLFQNNCSEKYF